MSMAVCQECGTFIDTDDDPGAFVEVDGKDRCICERCREQTNTGEFSEEYA